MATNFSHLSLPPGQIQIDNLAQLDQVMADNPQAVMDYILTLHEDSKWLNIIEANENRKLKLAQDIEKRDKQEKQMAEIEDQLPGFLAAVLPPTVAIIWSAVIPVTSSNIWDFPPWSSEFRIISENFPLVMWHVIIPFSFMVLIHIVSFTRGYSYSKLSPTYNQIGSLNLGMERRREQLINNDRFPYVGQGQEVKRGATYLTRTRLFADYVGNLHAGSPFSTWNCVSSSCVLLPALLVFLRSLFSSWEQESVNCAGLWVRGVYVLLTVPLSWLSWNHGLQVGFDFGMGCFAKRLRSECLRKDLELVKGEVSRKERLEALVREILQEEMVGVDEKDTEKFEFHRMAVDMIVKRIRC